MPISRFCRSGHDKDILGRTKRGSCRECDRLREIERHKVRYTNLRNDSDKYNKYILRKKELYNKKRHSNPDWVRRQEILTKRKKLGAKLCQRDAQLKHLYGITLEDYTNLLNSQSGVCAVCFKALDIGVSANVDHDHSCAHIGKKKFCCKNCVRGLTHQTCNAILGLAYEDSNLLRLAADYLDRWKYKNALV